VYIMNHGLGDRLLVNSTDSRLSATETTPTTAETTPTTTTWEECTEAEKKLGFRLRIQHDMPVKEVVWHCKGDYLATLVAEESNTGVVIHQLSKRRSQEC
jgi:ribosome biogenesis protein ERB1